MMEPTPERNKATVLEAFDTLFNKAPPRVASLSPEFQPAQEGGSNDKRSRGASSETMGLAHSMGASDGLFGRRLYQRSDRWAGTRGGATEGCIKADSDVCRSRRRRLRTKCTIPRNLNDW